MKLLFVHQYLGALGGAEANIHLTGRELRRRGHEVALLYSQGSGASEETWRETFKPAFRLDETQAQTSVAMALTIFRPNVIYVHNMARLDVLESLLNSRLPLVRMVHDHEMYCMRGYKYNVFTRRPCRRPVSSYCVWPCLASVGRDRNGRLPLRWVSYRAKRKEIRLNRRCRRVLVYSQYARQELLRNGFDDSKIQLYVPLRCWGTDAPTSSFSDRNLILYAGQIIRGKGVDVLLRALAQVKTPFECIILGDGSHRRYCEDLCHRLGLTGKVQFRGFVLREELKQFYLNGSVFVFSSVWPEPFGLAGPEAMRYGLPVVAFDSGAIREWLIDGENGFVAPWMDIQTFARRIEQLLQDKTLARAMGRRGMERVNRQYEAGRQIDTLEQMFQQVVTEIPTHSHPELQLPDCPTLNL